MANADRRIHGIADLGAAIGVIQQNYPQILMELSSEWMDRLSAAVGVVSIDRFRELADQFVARHVELVIEMVRNRQTARSHVGTMAAKRAWKIASRANPQVETMVDGGGSEILGRRYRNQRA